MINDLIKRCQENGGCKNCHSCGYNANNLDDEVCCLIELVNILNNKYKTNYKIIDYDMILKVKELLNEC